MYKINSDVSVCNVALARVGVSMFIESMTEATQAAQICNIFLSFCKERLLSAADWQFARKFVTLQNLGSPPTNWLYRYGYPSDCIKVRNIVVPGDRNPSKSERTPFEIAVDQTIGAKVILCDLELAEVDYTAKITDIALYPAVVLSALAWLLAVEIAAPLTADMNKIKLAKAMYDQALTEAINACSGEMEEEQQAESDFIQVRL